VKVKTFSAKEQDVERKWYVVDAQGKTLGRLASEIASILRGKHKPIFTPHVDCGDYVVVINAEKVWTTGMKMDQKRYYRHSGYPGGLREITLRDQLKKFPERVIESAVRGMLPKNRLGRKMYKKLKVYAGSQHPHAAQQPETLVL
jgi:large subunit ribosomal protein L13